MSRIRKSIETESMLLVVRGWEERVDFTVTADCQGVSFCDDENEIIVVVGYTTEYTKTTDLYTLNE